MVRSWSATAWVGGAGGIAFSACVAAPSHHGPLPVRNQHPVQLTVMSLPPATAGTLSGNEVAVATSAAYSSYFLSGSGQGTSLRLDGEFLRWSTLLRAGVGGGGELAAELPFGHAGGGFLDGFVIGYHDALGLPDQGRDVAARDAFDVEVSRGGQPVYRLEAGGLELLDVPLWYTQTLRERGDGVGVAVRAGVELPTGDEAAGFGNGGVDVAVGALFDWHLDGVELTAFAQHTFAATPDRASAAGLSYGDVTAIGGGLELPLSGSLAAIVQLGWETSALRDLAYERVARDQLTLWTGGRWMLGERLGLELSVGEDLISFVSPDFTAWLGLAWLPRRPPGRG